jgi:hypothetical protein
MDTLGWGISAGGVGIAGRAHGEADGTARFLGQPFLELDFSCKMMITLW